MQYPAPVSPYEVQNPHVPASALIRDYLLTYLANWRWDYRRTALLYALANLDGPALADFYRYALYYRAMYNPQEVELLNLVALKLAGDYSYVPVAQRDFNFLAGVGRKYLSDWQTRYNSGHTMAGCCPACEARGGSCLDGFQYCDHRNGWAFGVPYCGCVLGDAVDDMLQTAKDITGVGDNGDTGDGWGDDDNGWGGSNGDDDLWGSGSNGASSGGATPGGGDNWLGDDDDDDLFGTGTGKEPGASKTGGSTWLDDWMGKDDQSGEGEGGKASGWEPGGATPDTPKKTTAQKKATARKKATQTNWWQALPKAVQTATATATKIYCMAQPDNPMCKPGAPQIQNTPTWVKYCKQNPKFPGCITLLKQKGLTVPTTAPKTPPPPPGTQAVVQQAAQAAAWFPIVGVIALVALAYLLLG